jgi:hypothetical protein
MKRECVCYDSVTRVIVDYYYDVRVLVVEVVICFG